MSTATNGAGSALTANLDSITRTADVPKTRAQSGTMGKDDFLRLFTTQLKNQDPTDPVKNEAFVAQLAQFSQLEASTNMANSLAQLATALQGDRMMTASGLIGRNVQAPGIPAVLAGGRPVNATVTLGSAAEGVTLSVLDAGGKAVRSGSLGAQPPGQVAFHWDGRDDAGQALPDGNYTIVATATSAGQQSPATVSIIDTVSSISSDPATRELLLTLSSGKSVPFSSVTRVGG